MSYHSEYQVRPFGISADSIGLNSVAPSRVVGRITTKAIPSMATTNLYPWDDVWEFILDDNNFENVARTKQPWSATRRTARADDLVDSDSAYDDDEIVESRDPCPKDEKITIPVVWIEKPSTNAKSEVQKRLGWWRRRFKGRKESHQESLSSPALRDFCSQSMVPSHARPPDDHTRLFRSQEDGESTGSRAASAFEIIRRKSKVKAMSVPAYVSAENLSDEVSVIESIFGTHESRTDTDDFEQTKFRARQRWRRTRKDTKEEATGASDSDSRISTQRSRCRQSWKSRNVFRRSKLQKIDPDEISLINYLLETKGGFLLPV